MIIHQNQHKYFKIYSIGVEKEYLGTSINYFDETITFIFFYFPRLCRVYIVNGKLKKNEVPEINEKVNLIAQYDNKSCYRIKKFLEEKSHIENSIFYFPEIFFSQLSAFLEKQRYKDTLNNLYDKYKKDLDYGICDIN